MMKTLQKRVIRRVERLRLLHMPLFTFLEEISKVVNEKEAKLRFPACLTFAITAYAFICVSKTVLNSK